MEPDATPTPLSADEVDQHVAEVNAAIAVDESVPPMRLSLDSERVWLRVACPVCSKQHLVEDHGASEAIAECGNHERPVKFRFKPEAQDEPAEVLPEEETL